MTRRIAVTLAVGVPIGSFALFGALYWLVFAETVRMTVRALRAPAAAARIEDRRGA